MQKLMETRRYSSCYAIFEVDNYGFWFLYTFVPAYRAYVNFMSFEP